MARRSLGTLGSGVSELLWPTRCVGCDAPGTLLCEECRAVLPAIDQAHACGRCGAPFGSLVCTECTDCHGDEDGPSCPRQPDAASLLGTLLGGVCCYGVLDGVLRGAIRAYKDAGERRLALILADLVAQSVASTRAFDPRAVSRVAFVPATPGAYARRGFDHMQLVAQELSGMLGVELVDVLARRGSADQRGLSKEARLANVAGDVVCLDRLDGHSVLLLDDVLTTGATLAACSMALRGSGAVQVFGACVARAW